MSDAQPIVNAFLLCDQAFQQMPTGKWCVIGTFGIIYSREFPFSYAPFTVFICLSDFMGDAMVMVTVRDPDGGVVKAVRGQIPKIQMSILEFAFPFPPVDFARPGSYTLELTVANNLLAARSFRIEQMPSGPMAPPWLQPPPGIEPLPPGYPPAAS